MKGSQFWLMLAAPSLVWFVAPPAWAQEPKAAAKTTQVCKIYQLRDFAESEQLCRWIADTIPEVIQPGTWTSTPKFYPKLALLAICQTPKAHAEVEEFLKNLKAAVQATDKQSTERVSKAPARQGIVVPARFSPPTNNNQTQPTGDGAYLVPAPVQQPKHLFHFILRFEGSGMDAAVTDLAKKLTGDNQAAAKEDADKIPLNQLLHLIVRYEGEGIIDANVVEFMKVYLKATAEKEASADPLMGESKKESGKPAAPASSYFLEGTPPIAPIAVPGEKIIEAPPAPALPPPAPTNEVRKMPPPK